MTNDKSRPWDHLRKQPEPKQCPIRPGKFKTSETGANIELVRISPGSVTLGVRSQGRPDEQTFYKKDLGEFIEFLSEVEEQLEQE